MKIKEYKKKYTVTFELNGIDTDYACVKFDHDGWQEHQMEKTKKGFKFKTDFDKDVTQIEYIFKYVNGLDQEVYCLDPDNSQCALSAFGKNSVIEFN